MTENPMALPEATRHNIQGTVDALWRGEALSALKEFVRLPCKSRDFDAHWEQNGYLTEACRNAAEWGKRLFKGAIFKVLEQPERTPGLFFEIPATSSNKQKAVFFYGHFDKQPEAGEWTEGRKPFEPLFVSEKLYGRGAADDGYNFYAAMVAIHALEKAHVGHPRIVGLYETDEECGSRDFEYWMQSCLGQLNGISLVVAMDCGCADYERLWSTVSFRGAIVLTLCVRVADHGVHSGLASGIIPSSFMIARALLDRIENSATGEMTATALNIEIPAVRLNQMRIYAETVGDKVFSDIPWANGTQPRNPDAFTTVVMNTWKPQLCVTGCDGIPSVSEAGNVLRAATNLRLSVRLPPLIDAKQACQWITETLTKEPLFGCKVSVENAHAENGWNAPDEEQWFKEAMTMASRNCFGTDPVYCGCGGSIGILPLFDKYFGLTQYLLTGVLGPDSNAHGPNEVLRVDYLRKLTCAVAQIIASIK